MTRPAVPTWRRLRVLMCGFLSCWWAGWRRGRVQGAGPDWRPRSGGPGSEGRTGAALRPVGQGGPDADDQDRGGAAGHAGAGVGWAGVADAVGAQHPGGRGDRVARVVDVAAAAVAVPGGRWAVADVELHRARTAPEAVDA